MFDVLAKAFRYNIFDEFVENGGVRLDEFPIEFLWEERAQKFFVDNLTINYRVWVVGQEDAIVIADWKRRRTTRILIREISRNPHVLSHRSKIHRFWAKHNQPFLYGGLRVGFGCKGNRYISEHPEYQAVRRECGGT
ncbi:hypothetical protein OKA04_23530 [Luteolibacter flavescens]|uniref:Uncharacterized protein n=1 Tax=Luteolibacter flavescens TaxID=1859460 RepID=A0ABT3FWM5_9BACT|nr:hypothetical protein [Luteolibacter flavescens]MCW1887729.1 hypothetical protein [Luteolibacter flavescens]